jgi:hypothetical protein
MAKQNFGVLGRTTKVLLDTDITTLIKRYREHLDKLERHHGRKFMIERAKQYLTVSERYAMHKPFTPIRLVKSGKSGYPSRIHYFKPYLRGNVNQKRAALSVLRIVEDMRLPISKK